MESWIESFGEGRRDVSRERERQLGGRSSRCIAKRDYRCKQEGGLLTGHEGVQKFQGDSTRNVTFHSD